MIAASKEKLTKAEKQIKLLLTKVGCKPSLDLFPVPCTNCLTTLPVDISNKPSNEQIQHHACQKPDCNCGSDPRPALTDHIEGVTVQVFVKRLTMPHSVPFNVDLSSTTVKQLKAQYHIKVGTNCKYFTLLFNGRQLEDDHLLSDYNIQNESSVYLKLELRGC